MSDELTALQEAATQARAKADELKTALTDASTDEEKAEAAQADTDATAAESAFAEAQAKADADAEAAAAEATAKADAEAAAQNGGAADAGASRTGFVKGARAGDECVCPDGRKGTVHKFDEGLVCIPNADQG